jgi:hypothetical protein
MLIMPLPCNNCLYSLHFSGFEPSCSHGRGYEKYSFLSFTAVQSRRSPSFQRDISHPSSASVSKPSKKPTRSRYPLLADFLLGPDDGGDTLLRNAGLFLNYTALQPQRMYSSTIKYISLFL